jgi:hypothetical protein
MKKLPIGIQSFEDLRSNDYLYVDKTEIIHSIISTGRVYVLSRPRRFGKSLLISTIEALFKGRKDLFEGLYIYDKWDWSQQYPVIKIDWTQINHSTPDKMENSLCEYLHDIADRYEITFHGETAISCFRELICALHDATGKKVVVLIDGYDKPVTSHLFDSHFNAVQIAVDRFYQVMKGSDEDLKFVFLTGVSGFSGMSVFASFNSPRDITMTDRFASICGYTQDELENNFSDCLDDTAEYLQMEKNSLLEQIRCWYGGYAWDGKTQVYNPCSTLLFFAEQEFVNHWLDTGTPTFLINSVKRLNTSGISMEPFVVGYSSLKGYGLPDIGEVPLLFQTGYLTVKQKELINGVPRYTLGFPNSEVSKSFMTGLLKVYGTYSSGQIDKGL